MHLRRRLVCPPGVSALNALDDSTLQRHLAEKNLCFKRILLSDQ